MGKPLTGYGKSNGRTSRAIPNLSLAFFNHKPATFSKASRSENGKPLFSASEKVLEKTVPS
jgi:hypothetical protein